MKQFVTPFALASTLLTGAGAMAQCSPARLTNPVPVYYDRLGESVAASGLNAAIGSPWGDIAGTSQAGTVRMYERGIFGWGHVTTIFASSPGEGDHFGHSVAMSGDYVIAGAPNRDFAGGPVGAGAAYLYHRSGASWWSVQRMDPEVPYAWANLGESVALSGEIAVLGAPGHPTNGADRGGLVEVWEKDGPTFSRTARLYIPNAYDGDAFGASVDAFDGLFLVPDLVAVGAPRRSSIVDKDAGVVFLYSRSPDGWAQSDLLYGSDVTAYQAFGASVSVLGRRVAVGAPSHTPGGVSTAGAVYIFEQNADSSSWIEVAKITAPNPVPAGRFGRSVDLGSDDRLVVGCLYPERTYVFRRTADGAWTVEHELADPDGSILGADVAIAGDHVIIGDPSHAVAGTEFVGSALAFRLSTDGASDFAAFAPVVGPGTYYGCSTIANNDGSTTCGGSNASRDVWYRFSPPCSGQFVIDTIGSTFDTVVSVHVGQTGTAANTLACNDDRGIGLESSRITMGMLDWGTYLIRVSGSGAAAGEFTLNISDCGPLCSCDWNADHTVNSQDFFDFLGAFFAGDADYNDDGVTNSQDFFDFLGCFFAGC